MTSTADYQAHPPAPEPPRRGPSLLITLAATMLIIATVDITVTTIWPHTAHWVHLAVAVLTPLIVEIITQINNRRR
ncbi:hypothetical protein [Mycolicibacterium sp.]|uniref:hypothetical protein n=1 Tax=Mycolicibacterium sp. TaxID=2320850 RepID=UPI003D0BBB06